MAKFEPISRCKAENITELPNQPTARVNNAVSGMLWRKSVGNPPKFEYVPGSIDETIYLGEEFQPPPYPDAKENILNSMDQYVDAQFITLDNAIDAAKKEFEKSPLKAVYVRLPDSWLQLLIDRDHNGNPPATYLLSNNLRVQQANGAVSAVSDTIDFAVYEEVVGIEDTELGF